VREKKAENKRIEKSIVLQLKRRRVNRWIQTHCQRHSWNTTTPLSTPTVPVSPLSIKMVLCSPSKVSRLWDLRISSLNSLLSLSSSAITPSPPSIVNLLALTAACLFLSVVISSSPANNTPSNSVRSIPSLSLSLSL